MGREVEPQAAAPQLPAPLPAFLTSRGESWPGQSQAAQTQGSFCSGWEITLCSPPVKLAFAFIRKVLKYPKLECNG